jgi:spore germination cell wall hydrolase CwlJ-like protein
MHAHVMPRRNCKLEADMKLSMLLWLMSVLPQPLADQTCLATTVYLEARSQTTIGQMAVAEVAMRRRERGQWGGTVCSVVKSPHQFALTTTPLSQDIDNLKAFQKAWDIAGKSITNWDLPADERRFFVPHADHFATAAVSPAWSRNRNAITIGDHKFYSIN